MHSAQRDVEEFHRALNILIGESPEIRRPELRAALIEEEAKETVDAIRRGDFVEAIDGLVDILVVTYGAAVEFGIDLEPFWDEVQRTNLAKKDGPVREDGKRLKPDEWQAPRIAEILGLMRGHHIGRRVEVHGAYYNESSGNIMAGSKKLLIGEVTDIGCKRPWPLRVKIDETHAIRVSYDKAHLIDG